jgi:Concanavalin A-like lectin/glucanases superfamily
MKNVSAQHGLVRTRSVLAVVWGAALCSCSGGGDDPPDKRFAAQTYDEYTEPLTNAIIGSPSGVTVIPESGGIDSIQSSLTAVPNAAAAPPTVPDNPGQALWLFDDCDPTSHFLVDSTGGGANAQHALNGSCVPGIDGQAVELRTAKDVVQVPDEPEFTVGPRVGVAAWVHPTTVSGDQPIVIKRLNNRTSFSLGIHNGNIEMSVVLTTGKTVISRAPIAPGVWTHVGGTFDGTFVFLFINGQQFGQVFGAGTIRNVFAPVRIGATTQAQHFTGAIDNVFVSTFSDARDQIIAQSCFLRPSLLAVNPPTSGPVPFGTTVHYDVSVTDNDFGGCSSKQYNMFFQFFDPGISTVFTTNDVQVADPGQTVTFGVDVTGSEDASPGEHDLPFEVQNFGPAFEDLTGQLVYELIEPDCFVATKRELMITNTSVVDDPVRTSATAIPVPGSTATPGVWSFGHLMRELAPTPENAPAMTLHLFQHWLSDQTVNGFTVAARPAIQRVLLDIWPKTPTGDLDLDRSPLTLLAIVNRIDVRDLAAGNAGEGRFVFGVKSQSPLMLLPQFTVILEYHLVAQTQDDVMAWANRWHGLSSHPFPSEEYNAALEDITKRFAGRNAQPGAANGSALDELRTNELELSPIRQWELRGFALSPTTGFFDEVTVKETPDLRFNQTPALAGLVNSEPAAIKAVLPGANGHTIPEQLNGAGFLGGSVINSGFFSWNAPGITDPDARFHMSLNTCNGCHGRDTNTAFLMINPRFPGQEARLSPFLTGTTAFDQFTGQLRPLNDLARRRADLTAMVCGTGNSAASTRPATASNVPAVPASQ